MTHLTNTLGVLLAVAGCFQAASFAAVPTVSITALPASINTGKATPVTVMVQVSGGTSPSSSVDLLQVDSLGNVQSSLGAMTAGGNGTFSSVVQLSPTSPGSMYLQASMWDAGRMTDLGLLTDVSKFESVAYGISDAGQVAMYSQQGLEGAGFLYNRGTVAGLSNLLHSRPRAIDNTGEIVGDFPTGDPASPSHAFLWNAEDVTDLGTFGGTGSQAYSINDFGQVVGSAYLGGNSAVHAFLYGGAGLRDLGTLGGTNSVAFGINNVGQIVGSPQVSDGSQHAFLYSGGLMPDLGTLGGTDSQADSINSNGRNRGLGRDCQRRATCFPVEFRANDRSE
jgi:probable HAF family extracellular repeat protein